LGRPRMALMISEMAASMGARPIAVSGLIAMQALMPKTRMVATTDRVMVVGTLRITW
jgi:hypothetical protein